MPAGEHDRPVLLSLGSVNADFQARADRHPEPGETLLARDFRRLGGRKAANVTYLGRKLGAPSRLYARVAGGPVGLEPGGKLVVERFRDRGTPERPD